MTDADETSFASRLRRARLEAGLSQGELAGQDLSISYVSHLEAGRREPTPRLTSLFERRLELPRGYLAGESWGEGRHDEEVAEVSTADLAALASRVGRMRSGSSTEDLAAEARRAAELALGHDRPEMWWAMTIVEVRALMHIGDYTAAADAATALTAHPWVQSQPALAAEAHTLASKTSRRAVDRTSATHHAHRALEASADVGDPALRAEAVIAALATQALPGDGLLVELETLHHRLAGTHLGGLVAWTIGTHAFESGNVRDGLRWHKVAATEVNPDVDHRDWARFVGATCWMRVSRRVDDDVPELITLARQHLTWLGCTDELADLARTEAQWHEQHDRLVDARRVLDDALRLPGLAGLARGRLRLDRARTLRSAGDQEEVALEALSAARDLTLAGDAEGARVAWQLYDEVSTT